LHAEGEFRFVALKTTSPGPGIGTAFFVLSWTRGTTRRIIRLIHIARYVKQRRYAWKGAISDNQIHELDWLVKNGFEVCEYTAVMAARSGHIEVLAAMGKNACRHRMDDGRL
jgi:hypothetical protein